MGEAREGAGAEAKRLEESLGGGRPILGVKSPLPSPLAQLRPCSLVSGVREGGHPFCPRGPPTVTVARLPRVPSQHQQGSQGHHVPGEVGGLGRGPRAASCGEAIAPALEALHHVPERLGHTRRDRAVTCRRGHPGCPSAPAWGMGPGNRSRVGRVASVTDGANCLLQRGDPGPARGLPNRPARRRGPTHPGPCWPPPQPCRDEYHHSCCHLEGPFAQSGSALDQGPKPTRGQV